MRGLFLRRAFPEPAPKTAIVTLTGTGDSSHCYATINGTMVTSAGTYEVDVGTEIACYANSFLSGNSISLNGTSVATGKPAQYTYSVGDKNAIITFNYNGPMSACAITITEE